MTQLLLTFLFPVVIAVVQGASEETMIINGFNASRGQFPFMVSLQMPFVRRSLCGGALISAKWVLTAAHCSVALGANMILVAGSINSVKFDVGYQERRVHSIYFPGDNMVPEKLNDISLIHPTQAFTETKFIQFLPYQRCDVSKGDRVLIMGWGTFNEWGDMPEILQWAEADVNELNVCGGNAPILNQSGFACIRGNNKKMTTARKGDSGSPGIYQGKIFGVVSMGISKFSFGSLYTKTSAYHDWIMSVTLKSSPNLGLRSDFEMACCFLMVSSLVLTGAL